MLGKDALGERLQVVVCGGAKRTLEADVRRGLLSLPKSLPPKHFYDERGSRLFDRICETDAYYPTRAEEGLLAQIAGDVLLRSRPSTLVELGSGSARKGRCLLRAMDWIGARCLFVPFDVSEEILRRSAQALLAELPWLRVHGVVGDYDLHLDRIPRGGRRLWAFLGGTIGNFTEEEAAAFLRRVAESMGEGDRLLLGTDLVKEKGVLDRAYNDEEGYTAAFNRNVLLVINRELSADFDPSRFEHLAFFREDRSRIEMHLRSTIRQEVRIRALGLRIPFEAGETILTEISRKFTRGSVEAMLRTAGLELDEWYVPADGAFGISMARRGASA